jgi:hypothetical protein
VEATAELGADWVAPLGAAEPLDVDADNAAMHWFFNHGQSA